MKKILTVLLVTLLIISSFEQCIRTDALKANSYSAEDFVGYWINDDITTNSITKIFISTSENDLKIRVYGRCSPVDCEWETKTIKANSADDGVLELHWTYSTMTGDLTIKLFEENHISTIFKRHFTDNSSKKDYTIEETLTRVNVGEFDATLLSLFNGVQKITFTGAPGILYTTNQAFPLVTSNNDSTPPNQIAIAGSKFGKGFVLGFCHDSFFSDSNFDYFDNKTFTSNVLSCAKSKKILISVSHGEYFNQSDSNKFVNYANNVGFEVQFLGDQISNKSLDGAGLLISGSAWQDVSDSEIIAIKDFVNNGGILLIEALGWSWVQYHPEKLLEDLPANRIGKEFGIKWVDGFVEGEKENEATVFDVLYPQSLFSIERDPMNYVEVLEDILSGNHDLNEALSASEELRDKWINALENLYGKASNISEEKKELIFQRIAKIIDKYPYYFKKDHALNESQEYYLTWSREKLAIILYQYALPLNDEKKAFISTTLNLKDIYLNIWEEFEVLVLDNNKCYVKNLQFIYSFLDSLSPETHNLKLIMIGKLLGNPIDKMYLIYENEKYLIYDLGASFATTTKIGYAIDLWDIHIDAEYENPFPSDVPGRKDPYFSGAAAHELTHIIDFNLVYKNKELNNERQRLLANAGENHLNYLRSIIEDGFFIKNPGEFFASIGNQYFCDTWNTLNLALVRFNKNYKEPINQFLFFVRVISMDSNFVPFYSRAENGTKLLKKDIRIDKDSKGRVIEIDDTQNWKKYKFELNSNGNVVNISIEKLDQTYEVKTRIMEGEGEILVDKTTALIGDDVTVEIKPGKNYRILKILDNSVDMTEFVRDAKYIIKSINKDHLIEVYFELISYGIVSSSSLGGTISPSGTVIVNSGDVKTFTITPNSGYKIKDVKVDGASIGAVTTYTFENVTVDHTIEATFEPIIYTITASSSSGGTISPSGAISVNYGESKTLTITPNSGYKIKDVKVDGVSVGAVSTYTFMNVTSDHTITATFEKQITQTVIILHIGDTSFTVNGVQNQLDSPPIIKNGRTLLPIRAVVEALGGTVSWNDSEKKVIVSLGTNTIELWIGKSTAKVNGVSKPIDSTNSKVVPEIINSRTMLPLRFVTENLGAIVDWNDKTKTVTITYQG